jgi:hypothetical protein
LTPTLVIPASLFVIPAKAGIHGSDATFIKTMDSRFRGNDKQESLSAALLLALAPVHIINSFIVRPDILMIFLAMLCMYFALVAMETNRVKHFILSGLFAGLAAATKYNGGIFIVFPILAFLIPAESSPFSKGGLRGISGIVWIAGAAVTGFILGCPYAVIDPTAFLSYLRTNASLAEDGSSILIYGPAWKSYLTVFLPYGLGWITTLLGIAGFIVIGLQLLNPLLFSLNNKGENLRSNANSSLLILRGSQRGLVFISAFLIIYFITAMPRHQMVWYTLPVVPGMILLAGYFLDWLFQLAKKFKLVWLYACMLVLVLGYNTIYTLAYLNLYREKNVREQASEWIDANIPKGETIAIARNYFWTPGILRQYHPPYQLIEGGDAQSVPDQAFLGLKDVSKKANYVVLTEFEYRNYLQPKLQPLFTEQAQILDQITQKDYQEIASFNQQAHFLWFHFPKTGFPPNDWIMPNPAIKIYKKRN